MKKEYSLGQNTKTIHLIDGSRNSVSRASFLINTIVFEIQALIVLSNLLKAKHLKSSQWWKLLYDNVD